MSGAPGLHEKLDRALLMRETGLKCIGFIGIPKVINNLAALRSVIDKGTTSDDEALAKALSETQPRRKIAADDGGETLKRVQKAAYELWDDIYQPHSDKLLKILGHSHPDLPVFIVDGEYGPLFSMPHSFQANLSEAPSWEVNRLRTSLVAIAALRAQGGVGPQVTSHVWGLLKAKDSIASNDANRAGLEWLCSEQGSLWAVKAVDGVSEPAYR